MIHDNPRTLEKPGANAVTASQMQTALQTWDDWEILQPLTGGYRNAAFLVEQNGRRCVAKSTRRNEAAMRWLQPVHALARAVGFQTPDLIENTDGKLVCEGVTLETFVTGNPVTAVQLLEMLPQLQAFHQRCEKILQRPGFASSLELLHQTHGGDIDLNAMPEDLVFTCREHWAQNTGTKTTVIHGDLNPNNILIGPDGKYGLVDWDETRVDVPAFDTLALSRVAGQQLTALELALLDAWEVVVCWLIEPEHALEVAERFRSSNQQQKGQS